MQSSNGVTKLMGQYVGGSSTVPSAAQLSAALASGVKAATGNK